MADPGPSQDIDVVLFERVLDQALERVDGAVDRERLRARALDECAGIVAAAKANGSGGVQNLLVMLIPVLSAVVAVVCLIAGYGMRVFADRPYVGGGLITAALLAGAVAVGVAIGDLGWLLVAARSRPLEDGSEAGRGEAGESGEAWEAALLERGMVPFLLRCLEEARVGGRDGRAVPGSRAP
ncbi:hypothetical protein [Streptomyces pseudovenezuelae]|uniref:Phage holin family protein n=1 Tax=Streptomyces pseudovenezuelae TaxID=67350 RepID=A0ABT6LHM1_9ACTN|nr:hypothetical protein [Streptomyces pseudovenezuelae]MDH6215803.1 hypothetical protein [Streptomyces pseudovenezuelae]